MVISLVNQKGGVGKSTIAIAIASELLARGHRVLLVDADSQRTVQTWSEVAAEGRHAAPSVISMSGVTLHEKNQIPEVAHAFDFVVIDTPARLGAVMKSAILASDLVLVPCAPSAFDAWALAETLEVILKAQSLGPLKAALVVNGKRAGTALAAKARGVLLKGGLPVLNTELGLRQVYKEALGDGRGVFTANGAAHVEITSLVDEILTFGGEHADGHSQTAS